MFIITDGKCYVVYGGGFSRDKKDACQYICFEEALQAIYGWGLEYEFYIKGL